MACPTSVLSPLAQPDPPPRAGFPAGRPSRLAAPAAAPRCAPGDVLLTSYGVLRRDAEELSAIPFALAVFDEAQNLKNRGTQSWQAADHLVGGRQAGADRHADRELAGRAQGAVRSRPARLSRDRCRLRAALRPRRDGRGLGELRRVISPFMLRRLKIVGARRAAGEDRGRPHLRSRGRPGRALPRRRGRPGRRAGPADRGGGGRPLPYIHVFALLNLLKKICDHPALALGDLDRAERVRLGQVGALPGDPPGGLESGQKVVVFTQFLGMIELMARHLEGLGVGFVKLTGASVRRGEIVDRFNHDPACRVFLGSLKAGRHGDRSRRRLGRDPLRSLVERGAARTRPPTASTAWARSAPCRSSSWSPKGPWKRRSPP